MISGGNATQTGLMEDTPKTRLIASIASSKSNSDFASTKILHGEIQIVSDDDGKLVWECPNCGNRNQDKMNVARRTCGYIGTQFWNQGRTQEIKERVLHL